MKKIISITAMMCILLAGCSSKITIINSFFEFSRTNVTTETTDVKTLFINDDEEVIMLDGLLTLESGEINVRIIDLHNSDILWDQTYSEDQEFQILLNDIAANSELSLEVTTIKCNKMKLELESETKLVRNIEKPEVEEKEIPTK